MSRTHKDRKEKSWLKRNRTFHGLSKVLESTYSELENCIRNSTPFTTVKGENFVYFAFVGVVGEYKIKVIKTLCRIKAYEVTNAKDVVIGYLVVYKNKEEKEKPSVRFDPMGVAIYFSQEKVEYTSEPIVRFSDKRFRLISVGRKDYFCSVKWKSSNPEEE